MKHHDTDYGKPSRSCLPRRQYEEVIEDEILDDYINDDELIDEYLKAYSAFLADDEYGVDEAYEIDAEDCYFDVDLNSAEPNPYFYF